MYQEDWIIRQIRGLAKMLAKVVFKKDTTSYEVTATTSSDTDLLYQKLNDLINDGKINEAENLLFEKLDKSNIRYLELAIDFYTKLNDLSDAALEKSKFTREEINEGLNSIAVIFGVKEV